jgi:hypothetical protein
MAHHIGLPIPGQEFGDAPRRVIGDAGEQVGNVVVRLRALSLALSIKE